MTTDGKPDSDASEDLSEGTLLSHLVELRQRLVRASLSVVVVFLVLFPFSRELFDIASAPLVSVLPGGQMIATEVLSSLIAPLKLTLLLALLGAMPVVLYQTWAFVAPGLYKKEKRFAFPLLASSIFLFYLGVAFAYFVVFPLIFGFITEYASDQINVMTDVSSYLGFISMIILAFGIAFEVPVATVLVVWTGLTTPKKLAKARPYVFLIAFVVGMFLTPPDIFSQTLLAIPVYLLYEIGLVMSRFFVPRGKAAEDEAVASDV